MLTPPTVVAYERNIHVNVLIPDFKKENITIFFGCKLCGKKGDQEKKTFPLSVNFVVVHLQLNHEFSSTSKEQMVLLQSYSLHTPWLLRRCLQCAWTTCLDMSPKVKILWFFVTITFYCTVMSTAQLHRL